MSKSRIPYGDRLLMGSIGNLEGLRRRLPDFDLYDKAKVQDAIDAAGKLQSQLKLLLGSGGGERSPQQIQQTLAAQTATRSAGQAARQDSC